MATNSLPKFKEILQGRSFEEQDNTIYSGDVPKDFYSKKQPANEKKLRGGYYTPQPLAHYLANWALRSGDEKILEPSCGNGNFIVAILDKLSSISEEISAKTSAKITAVEIESDEIGIAKSRTCLTEKLLGNFINWQC